MAGVSFRVTLAGSARPGEHFRALRSRLLDMRPAMEEIATAAERHVRQQIAATQPAKPFGTRQPAVPRLGERLVASWTEPSHPEHIRKVTARTAQIGSRVPYARALREGAVIRPKKLARTRRRYGPGAPQRWAMWWALFLRYGVTLSDATLSRGLRLPPRPHGHRTPAFDAEASAIVSRYLRRRAA